MLDKDISVQGYIIKLVGLLDRTPDKEFNQYCKKFEESGYLRDSGPKTAREKQYLKDYLYPEFRNIMFSDLNSTDHIRYVTEKKKVYPIQYSDGTSSISYSVEVQKSELFLFKNYIGLFSLDIRVDSIESLSDLSNVLNEIRNFGEAKDSNLPWHEWISSNYLSGISLRSTDSNIVEADEYSGSKFKLYSVVDCNSISENRKDILYDIGTVSPIGSSKGGMLFSPDKEYYNELMKNRVAAFENWEVLCLFDVFCCVGNNFLINRDKTTSVNWDVTYFRIYLFRLFFKYNLYRFNTLIADADPSTTVKYRDQFENFLNKYHISHISYNFLPNLIYEKMGNSLQLSHEVDKFSMRITKMSTKIQEQKQAKTNKLLQLVTILSGLGFVVDVPSYVNQIATYTGITAKVVYMVASAIIVVTLSILYYYFYPEKVKKWILKR